MSNKKFVTIVTGVGDTLCSNTSGKSVQNANEFVDKVNTCLRHLANKPDSYGLINFHYPSDTFKDVNVFKDTAETSVVNMKIHSTSLLNKFNEMSIKDHDGEELLFNGDDFTFIFRPEEYDVYLCGIDLHGIFSSVIKELLDAGYNVYVFSNVIKALQPTHKYISTLQKNKNFNFCSYKRV